MHLDAFLYIGFCSLFIYIFAVRVNCGCTERNKLVNSYTIIFSVVKYFLKINMERHDLMIPDSYLSETNALKNSVRYM